MIEIQCPICKNEFGIELDISLRTEGMIVFRGGMSYLGNLGDEDAVLDFIREVFKETPVLRKEVLIDKLVQVCGIPHSDACHFVEKLLQEGFVYEPKDGELRFIG